MSFRIEEKLSIDSNKIGDFKNFLINKKSKKIYQTREISSLYFDNKNYEMYNDSIEGVRPRKKIRLRSYPNSEDTNFYLENKISADEGRFKTRKLIYNSEIKYFKDKGIIDSQYGICKPCLYVTYVREYILVDDVRVSIDTNINYKSYLNNFEQRERRIVVEMKASIKKDLDRLAADFPFVKNRFSKFCNAIERIVLI